MNEFKVAGCGSFWLVRCRVARKLRLQGWCLICSYVEEGVVLAGLVSLTSSPHSLELLSFQVRFNEHKNAFKSNSHTSNFAKHVNEQAHSFGSIHNTMQIL